MHIPQVLGAMATAGSLNLYGDGVVDVCAFESDMSHLMLYSFLTSSLPLHDLSFSICGHSIVFHFQQRAVLSHFGSQLNPKSPFSAI